VVAGLLALALQPKPAEAARHWFTDENRTLKTDLFEASASRNDFCDPEKKDSDLFVYLRFAPGADIEIGNNPRYLDVVESEVAPAVREVCGEVVDLVVLNFFAESFLNSEGNEVPVSRATFRNLLVDAYPASVKWVWFDAIYSGEFPPGGLESFGDSSLTTPQAIQAWLSTGSAEHLVKSFKESSGQQEASHSAPQKEQGDPKVCAKQSKSGQPAGSPAAYDLCRALERFLVERMVSSNAVSAQVLHRMITGESSMIEAGIYLEAFRLKSCTKSSESSSQFVCSTVYRLGSQREAPVWFELFGKGQDLDRTFSLARIDGSWKVVKVH
jgi:hypothetical protein